MATLKCEVVPIFGETLVAERTWYSRMEVARLTFLNTHVNTGWGTPSNADCDLVRRKRVHAVRHEGLALRRHPVHHDVHRGDACRLALVAEFQRQDRPEPLPAQVPGSPQ